MSEIENRADEEILRRAIVRFNGRLLGTILGLMVGGAIFIATNFLVLKGGPVNEAGEVVVGPHLELLGQFFIGYHVTFLGSVVGLLYGFASGFVLGVALSWIYNRIVDLTGSA